MTFSVPNPSDGYSLDIAGRPRVLPWRCAGRERFPDPSVLNADPEYLAWAAGLLDRELGGIRHDLLVTVAAGGIPLVRTLASRLDRPYGVAERAETEGTLRWAAGTPRDYAGSRVIVVDDWMRTGRTLSAIRQLLRRSGARVVGVAAVWIVGDSAQWRDVVHLGTLPQYPEDLVPDSTPKTPNRSVATTAPQGNATPHTPP